MSRVCLTCRALSVNKRPATRLALIRVPTKSHHSENTRAKCTREFIERLRIHTHGDHHPSQAPQSNVMSSSFFRKNVLYIRAQTDRCTPTHSFRTPLLLWLAPAPLSNDDREREVSTVTTQTQQQIQTQKLTMYHGTS